MIDNALRIQGWMSPNELNLLARLAKESNIIVEFGCFYGRSTRCLADNTSGIVHAVDPWVADYYNDKNEFVGCLDNGSFDGFHRNLADHISSGRVIPHRCLSWEARLPEDVDLVFIDGDHRYESVRRDIIIAKKLIGEKGIIAGHDYNHPDWFGVKKAVDEMFTKYEVVDTIWMLRF